MQYHECADCGDTITETNARLSMRGYGVKLCPKHYSARKADGVPFVKHGGQPELCEVCGGFLGPAAADNSKMVTGGFVLCGDHLRKFVDGEPIFTKEVDRVWNEERARIAESGRFFS